MAASWRTTGPAKKWIIAMSITSVSRSGKPVLEWSVQVSNNGLPYNPSGAPVAIALMTDPNTPPASGDWKTAAWNLNLINTYVFDYVVPQGAYVEGHYWAWCKIDDTAGTGALIIEQTGEVVIYV